MAGWMWSLGHCVGTPGLLYEYKSKISCICADINVAELLTMVNRNKSLVRMLSPLLSLVGTVFPAIIV